MLILSGLQWAGILAIFFVAAFVQGLSGFGFGVTSMGLLPLLLPIKSATPVVGLLNLLLCTQLFCLLRRSVHWRHAAPMVAGLFIGVPFGIYFLIGLSEFWLRRTLGVYLILIALHGILALPKPQARAGRDVDRAAPFVTGIAGGALGAAFNIGGPFAIAYVYRQPWPQQEMNATLQAFFLASCLFRVSAYALRGLYGAWTLALFLPALPVLFIGARLGHRFVDRVNGKRLRQVIYVMLGVMGAKYL